MTAKVSDFSSNPTLNPPFFLLSIRFPAYLCKNRQAPYIPGKKVKKSCLWGASQRQLSTVIPGRL